MTRSLRLVIAGLGLLAMLASLLLQASTALAQGSWAQATEVTAPSNAGTNPGATLGGISCSSAGNCTAAGDYADSSGNGQAMGATESAGNWAQATEVTAPTNAATNPVAALYGISCSSAGNCTAAGTYDDNASNRQAMVVTESGGSWAQATEVTAPSNARTNPDATLYGISCSSAGNCTTAGDYIDGPSGNRQAMVATQSGGNWAQATDLTAPTNAGTNPGAALDGISCSSAGNCTASGNYTDSSGNAQAMVATETPPPPAPTPTPAPAPSPIPTPSTGDGGPLLPVGALLVFGGSGLVAWARCRARFRRTSGHSARECGD